MLQPHQERVLAEAKDLADRLSKLRIFLRDPEAFALVKDTKEGARLANQEVAMSQYLQILNDRIADFPLPAEQPALQPAPHVTVTVPTGTGSAPVKK